MIGTRYKHKPPSPHQGRLHSLAACHYPSFHDPFHGENHVPQAYKSIRNGYHISKICCTNLLPRGSVAGAAEAGGATRDTSEVGGAGRAGSTTISIFIGRSVRLTCEYTKCKRDRYSLVGYAFSEEAGKRGRIRVACHYPNRYQDHCRLCPPWMTQ